MSTARTRAKGCTPEEAAKASWPGKKLAKALKKNAHWKVALTASDDAHRPAAAEAFAAAEKLAAAVVFRLMVDDDAELELFHTDVAEAVRFLWRRGGAARKGMEPSQEHLDEIVAWAEANHDNADAQTDLREIIEAETSIKNPFKATENGLVHRGHDKNGNEVTTQVTLTPIKLLALTRDHAGEGWGRLVELTDADKRKKRLALPAELLAGKGDDARRWLMRLGLVPASAKGAEELLLRYLRQMVDGRARCVNRPGWHPANGRAAGVYVTPTSATLAVDEMVDEIVLQSDQPPSQIYGQAGDLAGWQEHVGRLCVGNSRLVLAVSAALAAPLLTPTGLEGGGFHITGKSSRGKTTALHVAGSVCGGGGVSGFVRSWKTTGNGLEATAAEACDGLLCLDELKQIDAKDLAESVYALTNGQGKVRANRDGTGKRPAQWRLLYLSTGEIGIEDKIREDPRAGRAMAGQSVRCVEIEAYTGDDSHGLFENLHGHTDGAAMARALKAATERHYGTALPAFLAALVKRLDEAVGFTQRAIEEFTAANTPPRADGQVQRVAGRFGLLAAAGELGVQFGVLPWPEGEATRAAQVCFRGWMEQRGGTGPQEIDRGVEQVKAFLLRFGVSRFQHDEIDLDSPAPPRDLAGFRTGGADSQGFFVFPEVWKSEVCAGFDANAIARALIAAGKIRPAADGKIARAQRLPRLGVKKVVHILPALLADGEDDEADL